MLQELSWKWLFVTEEVLCMSGNTICGYEEILSHFTLSTKNLPGFCCVQILCFLHSFFSSYLLRKAQSQV